MITRHSFKKRSLFLSWLFSYIAILFVPVLISAIIYIQSAKFMELEITRANQSILKQVQVAVDSRLRDIERTSKQIGLNSRVVKALNVKGSFQASDRLNITKVKEDLQLSRYANGFIDDAFIYFKNSDVVLSIDSMTDSRNYYSLYKSDEKMTYEQWHEFVQQNHMMGYFPLAIKSNDEGTSDNIAYVLSLPVIHSESSSGTLVETIKNTKFKQIMEDLQWINQGIMLIVDNNNRFLVSTKPFQLPAEISYDNLENQNNAQHIIIDKVKYVISFSSSQIAEWKFVSIIPYSIFWEKIEYIRKLSFAGLFLCVILGAISAYAFSRKNYNPINKILNGLTKKQSLSFDSKYNEYSVILQAINDTLNEKESIRKKLENQNNILRINSLIRLLNGKIDETMPMQDILTSYDVHFDTNHFAVLLIHITDISEFLSKDSFESRDKALMLVKFITINIFEEIVNRNHIGYMVELEGMLACIVNFRNKEESSKDCENKGDYPGMLEIVKEAQQIILDKFHFHTEVSISDIHEHMPGISTAYQEAIEAMEYMLVMGNRQVVQYGDFKNSQYSYYYSIASEQKLSNFIKTGSFKEAEIMLDEIFKTSFMHSHFSIEIIKCMMFDIVSTIIKTVNDICDVTFLESLQPVKCLNSCRSVLEMKKQIVDMVRLVCEYVSQNNHNDHQLSDDIISFINRNYQDINLDISMIGNKFSRNASYLSTLFKDQTGENLLDCINKTRLDKAKQLLKEGDLNIQEIAHLTGYSNSTVFIRNFRKYEGITPGKYKII